MYLGLGACVLGWCCAIACAVPLTEGMLDTLSAMEAAVLSEDPGAYMALLDTSDPKFITEQRAWISDLVRNPVSEFSIEPSGDLTYGPELTTATLPVRIIWTLKADEIQREMSSSIKLTPINRNDDGPWRFAGRDWGVVELDAASGVHVYADETHKDLAERVLGVVPEIQSRIEDEFDRKLSVPLTIKIYPSMQELQYSIALGYLNPLSGWNEPGESIKILGRESVTTERISSLLAHEIGHAVSFEFGPEIASAPWWSLEGIAEIASHLYRDTPPEERELGIAQQVARGDRRSWTQLSDFKGEALNHGAYVYAQGWSMVRFITQRFGSDQRNDWFAAMGSGMSVQDATQSVLGVSMDDLDRMWETEMLGIAERESSTP